MKKEMQPRVRIKLATPTTRRRVAQVLDFLLKRCLIALVLAYQHLIAPLITHCCRFHPSCSTYAKEAITKYGVIKGTQLAIKRLARCHPWGGSGYDPVA